MTTNYSLRGRDESGPPFEREQERERERFESKSSQGGYSNKQSVQNSFENRDEEKVPKVSPPRRKGYRDEKMEKQVNWSRKDAGPESAPTGYRQRQQQQPVPDSSSFNVSRQYEKEIPCNDGEINALLEVRAS